MKDWYRKAKFGIFVHWGIYAVGGTVESWEFGNGNVSYDEYMSMADGFTASRYNADDWVELFKKAGAKYVVLTTKHHDGMCLFDTQYTDLTVLNKTPAKRDLIKPYCDAMHKAGLKTGVYFTNTDWSDIDHMAVLLDKTKEEVLELRREKTKYSSMWQPQTRELKLKSSGGERQEEWSNFLDRYKGQIRELLTNYGEIDLFWTDAMLYREGYSWDTGNVKNMIVSINPDIMVNGRLDGYGDFLTSEQRLPLAPISNDVWEYCHTLNESWGYRSSDKHYKNIYQLVKLFTECISMGGNMLLGVGPRESGEIPQEVQTVLVQFGEWIKRYDVAIYETNRGLKPNYYKGQSVISEDEKTIYIFVHGKEKNLMVNGLRNNPIKITCMKNGRELNWNRTGGAPWGNIPGCIWIDFNEEDFDDICTVVKIELSEKIDLWEITEPQDFGAQTK